MRTANAKTVPSVSYNAPSPAQPRQAEKRATRPSENVELAVLEESFAEPANRF